MDEKLVLLLGLGLAGIIISANCIGSNDDDNDMTDNGYNYDEMYKNYQIPPRQQQYYPQQRQQENYSQPSGCACNVKYTAPSGNTAVSDDVSPLGFSDMVGVGTNEGYASSDYIPLKSYDENPDNILVYNSATDSVGLPVTDMTDLSAAENSKYIYDRSIGGISWTSTKLNGRMRGQGDYIRGDIPIVPDNNPTYQVSVTPSQIMVGAFNGTPNGAGAQQPPPSIQVAVPSSVSSGGPAGSAHALRRTSGSNYAKPLTIAEIQAKNQKIAEQKAARAAALAANPGAAHALNAQPIGNQTTVLDSPYSLIAALANNNIASNQGANSGSNYI